MSMAWIAGGTAIAGLGASFYGANKQAQANRDANNANIAAEKESERQNWLRFLMTRGISPAANTVTGEIPGAVPGGALNTKLPLWAKVIVPAQPAPVARANVPFLIKKG